MITTTVNRLRAGFEAGRLQPGKQRLQQLSQLRALLNDNSERWIAALQADMGKAAFETLTTELQLVIGEIDYARCNLNRWMKPQRVSAPLITQPSRSYMVAEPKGVALIIGAWNYPIQLLAAPLVAAMAAGNAAILKPSELAPNTSALWAELLPRYLDEQGYAVVEGGVAETSELLRQRFDHIFYTGGGRVARIVMTAAAQQLTPLTLELGGKSPCLVAADADIDMTARRVAWGKFINAGQTCIAPDYVLVERSVAAALTERLKHYLVRFYGDDAKDSLDYARIVNVEHFDRLAHLLHNQEVVFGGRSNRGERYLEPTLVSDPSPDDPLMQEEIFGPILPLIAVADMASAIRYVRERAKPLALYVFSRNRVTQQRMVENLSAGSICINDTLMFMAAPELPFGGIGASGMGRYHGRHGFETFSHMKAVMCRSRWPDPNWRYPPFSARKLKILKRFW